MALQKGRFALRNATLHYANHVEIRATPTDFQFVFSHLTVERPDKNADPKYVDIQDPVFLSVSPQLAKKLMDILPGTVNGYEELFGEINMPPVSVEQNSNA